MAIEYHKQSVVYLEGDIDGDPGDGLSGAQIFNSLLHEYDTNP